jgi:prepilin-type N-terminal cleavage/methylation domain-containing protein
MSSRGALRSLVSGFTMVELMVVLALVAIIATIAMPSFQTIIAKQQQSSATRDLMRAVSEGRGDAIINRRNVEMWAAYPIGTQWNGSVSGTPVTGTGAPANTPAADLTSLKSQNASFYLVESGSVFTLGSASAITANVYPFVTSVSRSVGIVSNLTPGIQALRFLPNGTVVQIAGSSADTTGVTPIPVAGVVFTICPIGLTGNVGSTVTIINTGSARVGAATC